MPERVCLTAYERQRVIATLDEIEPYDPSRDSPRLEGEERRLWIRPLTAKEQCWLGFYLFLRQQPLMACITALIVPAVIVYSLWRLVTNQI